MPDVVSTPVSNVYTTVQIHIRAMDPDGFYSVEATINEEEVFRGGRLQGDGLSRSLPTKDPVKAGFALFEALFSGPLYDAYDKALNLAAQITEGRLRLRLRIADEADELHALPWELLRDPQGKGAEPLAASELTPFSRYISAPSFEPGPITERPVRLLVAVASPGHLSEHLPGINVEQEIEMLEQVLGDLVRAEELQVTILPGRAELSPMSPSLLKSLSDAGYMVLDTPVTLDVITRLLPYYHMFHFVGHGQLQRQGERDLGQTGLYLEQDDGQFRVVADDELISLLAAATRFPHLMFLSTSSSGQSEAVSANPFLALGPRLVSAGAPAVVAVHNGSTMNPDQAIVGTFYRQLLQHGLVDLALNQERQQLWERSRDFLHELPVLWTSLKEGRLLAPASERGTVREDVSPQLRITETNDWVDIAGTRLPKRKWDRTERDYQAPPTDTQESDESPLEVAPSPQPPPAVPAYVVRYQPPPVDNTLTVEVYPTTIKLTFRDTEYTGPNRINTEALLAAGADPRDYGELLFNGIIHSGLSEGGLPMRTTRDGYAVARNLAREGQLRFELRLDPNDLDLHRHRWEYLKHPHDDKPLALQSRFPFYRYQPGWAEDLTVPVRPLKILAAICNPSTLKKEGNDYLKDMEPLEVDREREDIETGLKRLKEYKVAEYQVLDRDQGRPATLKAIHQTLKDGYHVLHLVCHGLFIGSRQQGSFYLVMERKDGTHHFVSASEFRMLMSETKLRLVVLVACVSALSPQKDALRGLGPSLVRAGVPAVVAMQDYMPIPTARRFTQYFYDDLARSGQVDMAMAATRLSIYRDETEERGDARDWGIPALFMSTRDGKLFDVDAAEVDQRLPKLDRAAATPYAESAESGGLTGPGPVTGLETVAPLTSPSHILSSLPQAVQVALAAGVAPSAIRPQDESEVTARPQDRLVWSDDLDLNAKIMATGEGSLQGFVSGDDDAPRSPKLKLPSTVYAQAASALNAGKHIILIGPPGVGKTSLAKAICDYAGTRKLNRGTTYTTATADWTTFDTVGGYVPTASQTLQFRPGSFLEAIRNGEWLVIDEINRAEIDKAFGELFTVLSGQQVDLPYTVEGHQVRVLPPDRKGDLGWIPFEATSGYDYVVHPNWRIIGTMNVYDRSSLFSMSLAFMRRFAFVDVELPDEESLYQPLRDDWIKEHDGLKPVGATDDVEELTQKLNELLAQDTHLMRRRALGPAIAQDMIAYVGDRYPRRDPAEETMLDVLAEAFLLYAVPQLDGLDRAGIIKIYQELEERFGDAAKATGILARIKALYPYIPDEDWEEEAGGD